MPRKRKDFSKAVSDYNSGLSIESIAISYGVSRQSMWKVLKRRKVIMRQPKPASHVIWRGEKYTLRENGYMAKTTDRREYLHRNVWKDHNGPIPDGHDIHHKDENKLNNNIGNLEILTTKEHGEIHGFGGNQYVASIGRRPVK